eukprot:SAG11_NODE_213_length_12262_cov_8.391597_15_plen_233_part_00
MRAELVNVPCSALAAHLLREGDSVVDGGVRPRQGGVPQARGAARDRAVSAFRQPLHGVRRGHRGRRGRHGGGRSLLRRLVAAARPHPHGAGRFFSFLFFFFRAFCAGAAIRCVRAGSRADAAALAQIDTLSFLLGDPGIARVRGELMDERGEPLVVVDDHIERDPLATYQLEFANGVVATAVPSGRGATYEFEVGWKPPDSSVVYVRIETPRNHIRPCTESQGGAACIRGRM